MKLRKLADMGAALGAATLVGLKVLKHKHRIEKPKKSLFSADHLALYSSLIGAGLALWDMKRHHDHHLAHSG